MPLATGTQLGRYQIIALIGKGGMGEVYRALDPQVDREVAIKVSAAQFSERFEREARAVAALNHPNICTLFDVGPNYLVMEFVEGPTLAERIKEGALSLDDSYAIARQMAGALEHAHEKGIVHRDLKPANIKVRPDGMVKVLDFGLAKVGRTSTSDNSDDATLTMGATQPGSILGTPAYMSPEQAKGLQADKRADIWAFGIVLYEMLTGKRTYDGETISDVLAQVILKDPDWDQVPKRAERLLRWCLEKDPTKRLRDIGDATRLMDEKPEPVQVAPPPPKSSGVSPWFATIAMALAAGIAIWAPWRTPPPEPLRTTTILPPDGAAFDTGAPHISPDGKRIVFNARPKDGKGQAQLWVRQLDSLTAQPLPGTEQGFMACWDPTSRYVAFASTVDRKLKKIDVQGGPPVPLADLPQQLRGCSWSPGGVILVGLNFGSSLMRVSAAGGTLTPATKAEEGKGPGPRSPWFLPDGRHFLYTALTASGPNSLGGSMPVMVGSLDDLAKPGKEVAQAESNAVYAQGHLLYLRGSTLMAHAFDPDRLETTADAVPIAEQIPTYSPPARIGAFSVSANGLLVYNTSGASGQSRLTWMDRSGKPLTTVGDPVEPFGDIELSPDQKSLVASIRGSPTTDLWIYDMARGLKTRFTFAGINPDGIWSADGTTIFYRSDHDGKFAIYRRAANGTGVEEMLYTDGVNNWPTSSDGKALLFMNTGGGFRDRSRPTPVKSDVFVLPLTPEQPGGPLKPKAFIQTPFAEGRARFSPDGKWVAYTSDDSGKNEVFVVPYPGPGGKRQVSTGGGTSARWRHDGRELYYVTPTGDLMAAEVSVRNGSFEVGRVQKLFGGVETRAGYLYDVSLDGQKFILSQPGSPENATTTPPLTLVENWLGLIKK